MENLSRRGFLATTPSFGGAALMKPVSFENKQTEANPAVIIDLCGTWMFRTDPEAKGETLAWQNGKQGDSAWTEVTVPHTWQIMAEYIEYRGAAWYTKTFFAEEAWKKSIVRIEFEAVFHSAWIWVNGKRVGQHLQKGYTAFTLDITEAIVFGKPNLLVVRANNAFDEHMLPRGHSSDWAHDGGIFRPVQLLITDQTFLERVDVDATPNFLDGSATLSINSSIRSARQGTISGSLGIEIFNERGNQLIWRDADTTPFRVEGRTELRLERKLSGATWWHFDNPQLYRVRVTLRAASDGNCFDTVFGVRKLEVRDGAFYFNNEKTVLTGVERMAGSNPEFGMAEPAEWIEHDHRDLKNLNCIFTRVHWPQDKRVLEYCDRHGILMQSEVPTWGPNTFAKMGTDPDADIMRNGIEQLREMVGRDRNHPCIVSWGLCNEIGGQNPPAYNFAKTMLAEAKKIDPSRLCSYASHSLFHDQAKDVSGLMDFVECNEYIGSWQPGGPPQLDKLMDDIHAALPGKAIVISEYGYCACTADRPEGDGHRMAVLEGQNAVLRRKPFVAGAIFFCYNDYRTHVGDRGSGVVQQRVHGVVNLYGAQKPSYELLRNESGPIEAISFDNFLDHVVLHVKNRAALPAYTMRGYTLRALFYAAEDIPVARIEKRVDDLVPGNSVSVRFDFENSVQPERITFDVMRPTGFSAASLEWRR